MSCPISAPKMQLSAPLSTNAKYRTDLRVCGWRTEMGIMGRETPLDRRLYSNFIPGEDFECVRNSIEDWLGRAFCSARCEGLFCSRRRGNDCYLVIGQRNPLALVSFEELCPIRWHRQPL